MPVFHQSSLQPRFFLTENSQLLWVVLAALLFFQAKFHMVLEAVKVHVQPSSDIREDFFIYFWGGEFSADLLSVSVLLVALCILKLSMGQRST